MKKLLCFLLLLLFVTTTIYAIDSFSLKKLDWEWTAGGFWWWDDNEFEGSVIFKVDGVQHDEYIQNVQWTATGKTKLLWQTFTSGQKKGYEWDDDGLKRVQAVVAYMGPGAMGTGTLTGSCRFEDGEIIADGDD